ncbi:emp24/gp25L/p24 family/GOLD-domain-containing protein [Chytridium lagenaria]|nr:emp24/gp25L/p24 family/GOLD-domain-containing protein [Chytridium lagenaria]
MAKDVLAVGHFEVGEGNAQRLDVEIFDDAPTPNRYWTKPNVVPGSQKFSFTTHTAGNVHFCFSNVLAEDHCLHVDTGDDAMDAAELFKDQKLKPMEQELYRLERLAERVVADMNELKIREEEMRNVNESTNERVVWFSTFSIIVLISLGGWQIWYMRKFFQSKKLI